MKFIFYLPNRQEYRTIHAKSESYAVWKLLNQFRLIEHQIENYKIIKIKDSSN